MKYVLFLTITYLNISKVRVSSEGVLTIALDTQNYLFDTLSVIITAPNLNAITLGIGSKTVFESPFVLSTLATNVGLGASVEFREGHIGKHSICAEVGAQVDVTEVISDFAQIQALGIGATVKVNAKTIELAGDFDVGASVYYILGEDGKKPEIVGEKSKVIDRALYPIKDKARTRQYRSLPPQDPLMLGPKN